MTSLIEMPFDLDGGRPFVSVEPPGHDPLKFFLDTGAGFSAIDEGLAQELRLDPGRVYCEVRPVFPGIDPRWISGMDFDFEEKFGDAANVQNLGIPVVNPECPWMQTKPLRAKAQVDGLIGGDIFGRYIVEMDYKLSRVRFFDPLDYEPPVGSESLRICVIRCRFRIYVGGGSDRRLTCFVETNDPYVKSELMVSDSQPYGATLLIDTGLPTSLVVSPAFTGGIRHNVKKVIRSIRPLASSGEGECDVGRLEALSIGDSEFKILSPIVHFYRNPMWDQREIHDGIIGHDILRRFKIAFDYGNERLILKRNDGFDQRYEFDMSGTYLKPHPEGFELWKLTGDPSDSPAIEAGLKEGDIIIAINGKPPSSFTGDEVYQMFMEEKEYRLDVSRQDGVFTTCITTRRLI